jgi:hypothetical protein
LPAKIEAAFQATHLIRNSQSAHTKQIKTKVKLKLHVIYAIKRSFCEAKIWAKSCKDFPLNRC